MATYNQFQVLPPYVQAYLYACDSEKERPGRVDRPSEDTLHYMKHNWRHFLGVNNPFRVNGFHLAVERGWLPEDIIEYNFREAEGQKAGRFDVPSEVQSYIAEFELARLLGAEPLGPPKNILHHLTSNWEKYLRLPSHNGAKGLFVGSTELEEMIAKADADAASQALANMAQGTNNENVHQQQSFPKGTNAIKVIGYNEQEIEALEALMKLSRSHEPPETPRRQQAVQDLSVQAEQQKGQDTSPRPKAIARTRQQSGSLILKLNLRKGSMTTETIGTSVGNRPRSNAITDSMLAKPREESRRRSKRKAEEDADEEDANDKRSNVDEDGDIVMDSEPKQKKSTLQRPLAKRPRTTDTSSSEAPSLMSKNSEIQPQPPSHSPKKLIVKLKLRSAPEDETEQVLDENPTRALRNIPKRSSRQRVPTARSMASKDTKESEYENDEPSAVMQSTSRRRTSGIVNKDDYTGKWTITVTGPLKDDRDALKARVAKNDSTKTEDKVWTVLDYPRPMTRDRAAKQGLDVDDANVAAQMLTLRLSLKQDTATIKTIVYEAPDWDSQAQITKLTKKIGQDRRREAGSDDRTRHGYIKNEIDYLVKWFEERPDKQGDAMSMKTWKGLAADFNKHFDDREVWVESRKETVAIGSRSDHALMGICMRDPRILEARRMKVKNGSTKAASEGEGSVEGSGDGEEEQEGATGRRRGPGRPRKAR